MKTLTENQKLQHPKRISAVVIKKLFGLYDYTLPGDNIFANIAVLYGENGVGKSTILRMVFHLLSGTKINRVLTCGVYIIFGLKKLLFLLVMMLS
jgi:AAA15 family ATPase/GTPase